MSHTLTYECHNRQCDNYGVAVVVEAEQLGPYWTFPRRVICDCSGCEVPIVAIDGEPLAVGMWAKLPPAARPHGTGGTS